MTRRLNTRDGDIVGNPKQAGQDCNQWHIARDWGIFKGAQQGMPNCQWQCASRRSCGEDGELSPVPQ